MPHSLDHLGWGLREHQEADPILFPTVGYDRNNKQHHSLLLCLLMTSCDLSDQTKGWKTTRKIAVRVTPPWLRVAPAPEHPFCAELSLALFWGNEKHLNHLRVTDGEIQRGAWTWPRPHSKSVAGGRWFRTQPFLPTWGHLPDSLGMVRTGPEVELREASVCLLWNGL